MRSAARLKMGYYPLPESEGTKLRSLLSFTRPASVIDPCVGQGTALHLLARGLQAPTASRPSKGMPLTPLRGPDRSPFFTSILPMTLKSVPSAIGAWRLCFWNIRTVGCEQMAAAQTVIRLTSLSNSSRLSEHSNPTMSSIPDKWRISQQTKWGAPKIGPAVRASLP